MLAFFTDEPDTSDEEHVAVVVVQRTRPPARQPIGRSLHRWLSTFGRRPPPVMDRAIPQGWDATVDVGGPREVLLSRTRRLARVAGRELVLAPHGQTLVVLVDARVGDSPAEHPIVQRVLTIPPMPALRLQPGLTPAAFVRRSGERSELLTRRVSAALAQDAAIRDFMQPAAALTSWLVR